MDVAGGGGTVLQSCGQSFGGMGDLTLALVRDLGNPQGHAPHGNLGAGWIRSRSGGVCGGVHTFGTEGGGCRRPTEKALPR